MACIGVDWHADAPREHLPPIRSPLRFKQRGKNLLETLAELESYWLSDVVERSCARDTVSASDNRCRLLRSCGVMAQAGVCVRGGCGSVAHSEAVGPRGAAGRRADERLMRSRLPSMSRGTSRRCSLPSASRCMVCSGHRIATTSSPYFCRARRGSYTDSSDLYAVRTAGAPQRPHPVARYTAQAENLYRGNHRRMGFARVGEGNNERRRCSHNGCGIGHIIVLRCSLLAIIIAVALLLSLCTSM